MVTSSEVSRISAALAACFDDVAAPFLAIEGAYVSVSVSWRRPGRQLITLTMSASEADEDDADDEDEES